MRGRPAMATRWSRPRGSATALGFDRRGGRGYGVEGGLGIDPEAAEAGMAALGEQDRQLDACSVRWVSLEWRSWCSSARPIM